jgi:hypothetical protein
MNSPRSGIALSGSFSENGRRCFRMGVRYTRRFALAIACLTVLAVTVEAQNQRSRKPHHSASRSRQKPVSHAVPRSLPSSAVPQVTGTKGSASNQELSRIERSSVSHIRPVTQQKAHAAAVASHPSASRERSTPMNFSYQAPHSNAKTSRPPGASRTH